LGAQSAGGLALPSATPTAGQFYAPRGVWTDGTRLAVADTGNHRVLIWHSMPSHDGAAADVVLGQSDFVSEGPAASGRGSAKGFFLPTGLGLVEGRFVVADAWHHRLVVYDELPLESDVAPLYALGQANLDEVLANRGGDTSGLSFYWPFGFALVGGTFWVADTGNRRVLGWSGGLGEPGVAPDIVLGQPSMNERGENRGGAVSASSFRWPHSVAGDDATLFVADAGDHRVLGWSPLPTGDRPANMVVGQADFTRSEELTYRPQGPQRLRFPYAVVSDDRRMLVADTANNRVLAWEPVPRDGQGAAAKMVFGQDDFDLHGENRWLAITDDSLCWPYGLSLCGDVLAIADSGNNRVVLWSLA